jgi:coenzyme F420-0:L-glutamate ligase/coenzyme F420-1:gamma-L-glutamate ligase
LSVFQPEILLYPVLGLPEAVPGLDLGAEILKSLQACELALRDSDIVVVAHKVISKAEGKLVRLADVTPSERAARWAAEHQKDPRVVELALREARAVVRMDAGVLITETAHGLVCANSGVDTSNAPAGFAVVLPDDPDASAERLRSALIAATGAAPAVIISDTFGRPWREGLVNVAIGLAGLNPLTDYRGMTDCFGKTLRASVLASADEIASAAELIMGKARRIPAVVVRGFRWTPSKATARELQRDVSHDLFR